VLYDRENDPMELKNLAKSEEEGEKVVGEGSRRR
jgi:hypothetical protein